MGILKSVRVLQQQATAIQRGLPPVGVRLAAAQARMANATQMLAAQTQAASVAASIASGAGTAAGHRYTVTISGMRPMGMVNFDLLVQFDLTVLPDGRPQYPATTAQTVSQMQIWLLRPGLTLQAVVDPSDPAAIWLDLASLG
jgi:archaellum component FlaG (FlaF/FlaG flagellin family)